MIYRLNVVTDIIIVGFLNTRLEAGSNFYIDIYKQPNSQNSFYKE